MKLCELYEIRDKLQQIKDLRQKIDPLITNTREYYKDKGEIANIYSESVEVAWIYNSEIWQVIRELDNLIEYEKSNRT